MTAVAIISPLRFQESVKRALAGHDFGCTFRTFAYDGVSDIDRIAEKCRGNCDVILFTGELGYHYMRTRFPEFPVPCAFTVYGVADVLSILLSFCLRHPKIPLNRVYLDFLTPQNNYLNIRDYLPANQMPHFFEEGNYDYTNITGQAIRLWKAGQIDFVISRSISNLSAWEEEGIPYEAVFPTESMIRKSVEEAVNRELLRHIEDHTSLTFILHLPESESTSRSEMEYRQATVYKFLVDSRKKYGIEFSVQQGFDRFVCRSTVTENRASEINYQKMIRLLQQEMDFPFSIGIGLHPSEQMSQYHAERALLESNRYGQREGFLVSGEPEIMMGPLSKSQTVRYSYQDGNVSRFARKLGVGNANLLRLVGMYRADPHMVLAAADLAPVLGVTLRSARRILQKLSDMGIIMTVPELSEGSRGRPMHRYVFVQEALERALSGE